MFHSMVPIVCLLSDYLSNSLIVHLDRRFARTHAFCQMLTHFVKCAADLINTQRLQLRKRTTHLAVEQGKRMSHHM